jgi:uncharacterized protein
MDSLMAWLKQPWHWAVAGTIIGLMVPALLLIGNKSFGISSSFKHICAIVSPVKPAFFRYNWRKEIWQLYFVGGILIGGFLANYLFSNPAAVDIAAATKADLAKLGITNTNQLLPTQIFTPHNIFTLRGLFFFVIGGFLVGFGTRYAGGCTSGHAITGLANWQKPSLIATCAFMAGGFLSANIIVPFILQHF